MLYNAVTSGGWRYNEKFVADWNGISCKHANAIIIPKINPSNAPVYWEEGGRERTAASELRPVIIYIPP